MYYLQDKTTNEQLKMIEVFSNSENFCDPLLLNYISNQEKTTTLKDCYNSFKSFCEKNQLSYDEYKIPLLYKEIFLLGEKNKNLKIKMENLLIKCNKNNFDIKNNFYGLILIKTNRYETYIKKYIDFNLEVAKNNTLKLKEIVQIYDEICNLNYFSQDLIDINFLKNNSININNDNIEVVNYKNEIFSHFNNININKNYFVLGTIDLDEMKYKRNPISYLIINQEMFDNYVTISSKNKTKDINLATRLDQEKLKKLSTNIKNNIFLIEFENNHIKNLQGFNLKEENEIFFNELVASYEKTKINNALLNKDDVSDNLSKNNSFKI